MGNLASGFRNAPKNTVQTWAKTGQAETKIFTNPPYDVTPPPKTINISDPSPTDRQLKQVFGLCLLHTFPQTPNSFGDSLTFSAQILYSSQTPSRKRQGKQFTGRSINLGHHYGTVMSPFWRPDFGGGFLDFVYFLKVGTHCNVTPYRNTVSWQCGRDSLLLNVSKVGYAVTFGALSVFGFASKGW